MFVVIFEVQPRPERKDEYLELGKELKPRLEAIDGFIDNERFSSRHTPGRVLSLSTWRDEKSVVRWRSQGDHRQVQEKGRFEVFQDYRLRVGEVTDDTETPAGLPLMRQIRFDETEAGEAKTVTIAELTPSAGSKVEAPSILDRLGIGPGAEGLLEHEVFESIYTAGKLLLLAGWRNSAAASAWTPPMPAGIGSIRRRTVRIIREYGMFDRREAPQFYPEPTDRRATESR
jgi:heme-degrading monooxygenase HmoA